MEKKLLILLTLSTMLFGCQKVNVSTSNSAEPYSISEESSPVLSVSDENSPSEETSSIIESSSIEEVKGYTIKINYKYPDGTVIDSKELKLDENESYDVESPSINFMKPSVDRIFDVATENKEYDVTYNYSNEVVSTVKKGQQFDPFYVDKTKGLSFSYIISGNTSDYAEIFSGNTFTIYNATLRAKDAYEPDSFYADFYTSDAICSNGAEYDSLLTEKGYEILVTICLLPDGSINFYKDKQLVFTYEGSVKSTSIWDPTESCNQVTVSDLTHAAFDDIRENGFKMGLAYIGPINYTIKDLRVSYALTPSGVANYCSTYGSVTIDYVDMLDRKVSNTIRKIGKSAESYSIESPTVNEWSPDKETVTGKYSEMKKVIVTYSPDGENLLEEPYSLDKTSVGSWGDKSTWRYIANDLEGDFKVAMLYHMNACLNINIVSKDSGKSTNAGDYCWRTILSIIEDSDTKDRWVNRIDWYGWEEDLNSDGKQIGDSGTYSYWLNDYTWEWDLGPILRNCNVYVVYERVGNYITVTSTIMPLDDPYKGLEFTYICTLSNVSCGTIDIAFTAEYTKVDVLKVIKMN